MVVMVMENVSEGLRGEITRWFLEVKAGTFVGVVSAAVRERIWSTVQAQVNTGAALMIYAAQTEQGFAIEMCHTPRRSVVEMEGLYLIRREVE